MAAVQMQPPLPHRPSMDRSASFDSTRRPFLATYERPSSPFARSSHTPSPLGGHSHSHSHTSAAAAAAGPSQSHSRSSSTASSPAAAPQAYVQPFAQNYFAHHPAVSAYPPIRPFHQHHHHSFSTGSGSAGSSGAWTATAIPATAFYGAVPAVGQAGFSQQQVGQVGQQVGQVFHPGFQQSQADFAAWANAASAYQHMMMANLHHQHHQHQQHQEFLAQNGQSGSETLAGGGTNLPFPKVPFDEDSGRKRTSSGPASHPSGTLVGHQRHQSLDERTTPHPHSQSIPHSRSQSALLHHHPQQSQTQSGSGTSVLAAISQNYQQRQVPDPARAHSSNNFSSSAQGGLTSQQAGAGGVHPYKRSPGHRPSRENVKQNPGVTAGLPRSRSQPSLSSRLDRPTNVVAVGVENHVRTSSVDSPVSTRPATKLPAVSSSSSISISSPPVGRVDMGEAKASFDRDSNRTATPTTPTAPNHATSATQTVAASSTPTHSIPASTKPLQASTTSPSVSKVSKPLYPGPIAAATNQSQSPTVTSPDQAEKPKGSGGLRGRLAKALHKDKTAREKSVPTMSASSSLQSIASLASPPPSKPAHQHATPTTTPKTTSHTYPSPSETSTRSGTPPQTPPQHHEHPNSDLPPPSAPFAIHSQALSSEISLAETGRTEKLEDEKKSKRGLFRLKNKSTDNISLSSTVSSASMMIRKMGSLGKLARRNSLMGISKIFKDKPKDEDAALPETEGKKASKKEKKDKKKGKGELAPVEVVKTSVEADDDDRALAGLSPAAKLARQHTLKSKAEEAKRLSSSQASIASSTRTATGEPTWDNNTVNRSGPLPALGSVLPAPFPNSKQGYAGHASPSSHPRQPSVTSSQGAPEVVHVQPRNVPSIHRPVTVSETEYDSADDDSSDGETIEDVTFKFGRNRLSDDPASAARMDKDLDLEFRSTWGNSFIDRNAVPKKGILKTIREFALTVYIPIWVEELERKMREFEKRGKDFAKWEV